MSKNKRPYRKKVLRPPEARFLDTEDRNDWVQRMKGLGLTQLEINNCLKVQCVEDFHDYCVKLGQGSLFLAVQDPEEAGGSSLKFNELATEYSRPSSKPGSDRKPKI